MRTVGLTIAALAITAVAALVPGSGQAAPVAYGPGDIIVADSLNKAVKAVDPDSGATIPVSSGGLFELPLDVTFAADGDILVVDRDAFGGDGGVIRIDSVTASQTTLSSNAVSAAAGGKELFSDPAGLDRKGNALYIVDFDKPDRVIKVDIDTGRQSSVSKGGDLNDPFSIEAGNVAKPLVADPGAYSFKGGVMEINPKTGKQTKISSKGDFNNPGTIELRSKGAALVGDPGAFDFKGALFEVDLKTGKQKALAKGGDLRGLSGTALLDKNTAYVSNCCFPDLSGSILRVNLKTGNQTDLGATGLFNPLGIGIAP